MRSKGYGVPKFQKDLDLEVKMVQCGAGGDAGRTPGRSALVKSSCTEFPWSPPGKSTTNHLSH